MSEPAPPKKAPPFPAPWWEVGSWAMFDFANSSFTTIIVTVIFGVYFTKVVCGGAANADFLWSLGALVSQSVVLLTAPVLGAIADFSARKKRLLTVSWLVCCVMTSMLWLVTPGAVALGLAIFVVANIAYSAGENIAASFLPELVPPRLMGRVSGFGWAWGYIGGMAALLLCYPLFAGRIDAEHADDIRLTTVVTGAFFFLAGLPTILFLRERAQGHALPPGSSYASVGFRRVRETLGHVRQFRELAKFLVVFTTYNFGVAIVVYFAAIFADKQIGMTAGELAIFFILLQVTSTIGALAFGFLQDRIGARRSIQLTLVIWLMVTAGCYVVTDKGQFFIVGNLAGLAIGSSQSAARALTGVLSPRARSGEFFGFWGLGWKLSSAFGPLVFGAVSWAAGGDQRTAILVTGAFFLAGLVGMFFVDEVAGRAAAEAADAEAAAADARSPA